MPRGSWVTLSAIYELIEKSWTLDAEDYEWQSPTSNIPKWKRNVRNVLQHRRNTSDVLWNKAAKYRLS
jgi:hypothetical protein